MEKPSRWMRLWGQGMARDGNGLVAAAQSALQEFWGTPGMAGAAKAAEACRKLNIRELELVEMWVPNGTGSTARRCEQARQIVRGVITEKKSGR